MNPLRFLLTKFRRAPALHRRTERHPLPDPGAVRDRSRDVDVVALAGLTGSDAVGIVGSDGD